MSGYRRDSHHERERAPQRSRWRRFVDWALNREPPITSRRTEAEIREFARAHLEPHGAWIPEVGIQPRRENGRIVWYLCTNVPNRGGNTLLWIDDETLEIVKQHHLPL